MSSFPDGSTALTGLLHLMVAFDWGEEVQLEHARRLGPAEIHVLPRRRRTPSSITFRPPPLRFPLGMVRLELPEVGAIQTSAEATVFDFAGVSVAMHVPFTLPAVALRRLADWLADPTPLIASAITALEPLYRSLQPAIVNPRWQTALSEEYFVVQLPPGGALSPSILLQNPGAEWLAGLLRLEGGPLSQQEITEALRLSLSYSPHDLFVPDWGVAFLLDSDCEETLLTIEYTNLQLLEYRQIDNRLDDSVATAYRLIHPLTRSWLPFWQTHSRPLRALGELKVEANELFERTGNAFKLVGDQYLARVYGLLGRRFHLEEWEQSIQRKLSVLQGVYEVLADQTATYRAEVLEIIIVLLIAFEIVLAFFPGHR